MSFPALMSARLALKAKRAAKKAKRKAKADRIRAKRQITTSDGRALTIPPRWTK